MGNDDISLADVRFPESPSSKGIPSDPNKVVTAGKTPFFFSFSSVIDIPAEVSFLHGIVGAISVLQGGNGLLKRSYDKYGGATRG